MGANFRLCVVGGLLIAYGLSGALWFFAPMHQRDVAAAGGGTIEDTMHIVLCGSTGLLCRSALAFGAAAFGKGFRIYTIATMVILVESGLRLAMDGLKSNMNLPAPWVGVTERLMIGVVLLWMLVPAIVLLRGLAEQRRSL